MKSARIYPLRTCSDKWKIKIYTNHICSTNCSFVTTVENYGDTTIIFVTDNPEFRNGKCDYYDTNQISSVKISDFDENNPHTLDGYLLSANQIVIPDNEIYIMVTFPLENPVKIKIKSNCNLGFTLSNLIANIRKLYEWIYKEEERTTIEQDFLINMTCECALQQKQYLYDKCVTNDDIKNDVCSICLEKLNGECASLKCCHYFHMRCIDNWIKEDGKTCPLCREFLYKKCDKCNGDEYVKFYFRGKLIPPEIRNINTNIRRNKTFGRFGIDMFDVEELILTDMIYDKKNKILSLNMLK